MLIDPHVESVISKHRRRALGGLQKYGVDTTRRDLSFSDWIEHLQSELMDAAIYCERILSDVKAAEAAEGE